MDTCLYVSQTAAGSKTTRSHEHRAVISVMGSQSEDVTTTPSTASAMRSFTKTLLTNARSFKGIGQILHFSSAERKLRAEEHPRRRFGVSLSYQSLEKFLRRIVVFVIAKLTDVLGNTMLALFSACLLGAAAHHTVVFFLWALGTGWTFDITFLRTHCVRYYTILGTVLTLHLPFLRCDMLPLVFLVQFLITWLMGILVQSGISVLCKISGIHALYAVWTDLVQVFVNFCLTGVVMLFFIYALFVVAPAGRRSQIVMSAVLLISLYILLLCLERLPANEGYSLQFLLTSFCQEVYCVLLGSLFLSSLPERARTLYESTFDVVKRRLCNNVSR